ncbi:MAG: DUF748 domain-containing protein [Candidatus Dactylopiibacterium sp.]|nr:DUF748 domain-containing protein [Candidatus Dactylopiibacterium sp.]
MTHRKIRFTLLLQAMLPLVVAFFAVAYYFALHTLKDQVVAALGATGEVGEVRLGFTRIEIEGLRIRASLPRWPGEDELRAARVEITPDLRSLFGGRIVIRRIGVEDATLTLLRRQDGLRILPALLGASPRAAAASEASAPGASAPASALPPILIGHIALRNSRVDFYDATVAARPHPVALEDVEADLESLQLPQMNARSPLTVRARIGPRGTLSLKGWIVPAKRDADLRLKLAQVPLKLVEPYLFRNELGEVRGGELALDLHARVANRRLEAPGRLTLSHLELGGLAGLTREAAAAVARSRGLDADTQRPVDLDFTLQGNLDDGRFSLNDAIYGQAGLALVKLIGLGGSGTHRGAQGGLGNMLRNLFGR